jgi:hypothetical protein
MLLSCFVPNAQVLQNFVLIQCLENPSLTKRLSRKKISNVSKDEAPFFKLVEDPVCLQTAVRLNASGVASSCVGLAYRVLVGNTAADNSAPAIYYFL